MSMDCTYRLRIPHQPGQLAQVALKISEEGGLIGDVYTISVARLEATLADARATASFIWRISSASAARPG